MAESWIYSPKEGEAEKAAKAAWSNPLRSRHNHTSYRGEGFRNSAMLTAESWTHNPKGGEDEKAAKAA